MTIIVQQAGKRLDPSFGNSHVLLPTMTHGWTGRRLRSLEGQGPRLPSDPMISTPTILTTPAPGTAIKPIYEYTQEQKHQMVGLRQASQLIVHQLGVFTSSVPAMFKVCRHRHPTPNGRLSSMGIAMVEQTGYHSTVHACDKMESK
jgi:hypothetical protein